MNKDKNKNVNIEEKIRNAKVLVTTKFSLGTTPVFGKSNRSGNLYENDMPEDVQDVICELSGEYLGVKMEYGSKMIALKQGEDIYRVFVIGSTTSSDVLKNQKIAKGDKFYTIAIKVEDADLYVAAVLINESEKRYFESVKNVYGRANAIKNFYTIYNSNERSYIKSLLDHKYYDNEEFDFDALITNQRKLVLRYALTKNLYTLEQRKVVEAMFRDPNAGKHKVDSRLQYFFSIPPETVKTEDVDLRKIQKALDEKFYKMDSAKEQVLDFLAATNRAGKKGFALLLVGSPGVGKTELMNTIAQERNIPFENIPVGSLSNPLEIEGLDPGYESADAGAIIRAYAAHGTTHMMLGLDEFDKMNQDSKEGNPFNAFLRYFNGECFDRFVQCTFDSNDTIFIATANNDEDIPEAVLNRFDAVIQLEDYSFEDKYVIAQKYIVPDTMAAYNIDPEKVRFDDEAIRYIISQYCGDEGARELKHNIEKIMARAIREEKVDADFVVTVAYVDEVLGSLVEENSALTFNRNRDLYSKEVAEEIKRCIQIMKKKGKADLFGYDKQKERLHCLLACKNEKKAFLEGFQPQRLSTFLHENLFGMDNVIKEVTNLYYTAYLKGDNLNSNLALCGGFGVGKSTIVKNIAEAMDYAYIKISLNGVENVKELRGFASTYMGSAPGRIMKGYRKAGTLRTVVQLDEIDKLSASAAEVLIDLLDREFTDSFLDVPVDLSQSIFIATANDWGKVPAVIRDRFIKIDVDGYSRNEKEQIVSDYIIPKLERAYAASGVSIKIEDEAKEYLLKTYAKSFGVRDAEKAMQRICASKLVDQADAKDSKSICISKKDVTEYLGEEPITRGNFPVMDNIPGVAKALAVSNGNLGNCFAIETVLLDGAESLEMTGLPKESATDSVKIAVTCIKKMYPDLLKDKKVYVHFGEGSVPKDGPSAGVALFMSILSAAIEKPLMYKKPYDIAYTGEISLTGGVFAIGGELEKIQAASDSGCKKVFIPEQNYARLDKEKLKAFDCQIIPVSRISQVVEEVFPELSKTKSGCKLEAI